MIRFITLLLQSLPLDELWTSTCQARVTRMAYSPSLWLMANWLVKQNQPVSKIETKSDTNLRSLYESWFRNALISKSVILWWQVKKGINSELEGANICHSTGMKYKSTQSIGAKGCADSYLDRRSGALAERCTYQPTSYRTTNTYHSCPV